MAVGFQYVVLLHFALLDVPGILTRSNVLCPHTSFYHDCWIRRFPGLFLSLAGSEQRGARVLRKQPEVSASICSRKCCDQASCNMAVFMDSIEGHDNCQLVHCPHPESCVLQLQERAVLFTVTAGVDPDLLVFNKLGHVDFNPRSSLKWERSNESRAMPSSPLHTPAGLTTLTSSIKQQDTSSSNFPQQPSSTPHPSPQQPLAPPHPSPQQPLSPPRPSPQQPLSPPRPSPQQPLSPPPPSPQQPLSPPRPSPKQPLSPPRPSPQNSPLRSLPPTYSPPLTTPLVSDDPIITPSGTRGLAGSVTTEKSAASIPPMSQPRPDPQSPAHLDSSKQHLNETKNHNGRNQSSDSDVEDTIDSLANLWLLPGLLGSALAFLCCCTGILALGCCKRRKRGRYRPRHVSDTTRGTLIRCTFLK